MYAAHGGEKRGADERAAPMERRTVSSFVPDFFHDHTGVSERTYQSGT
jgi:hypothetical protein